MAFRFLFLLFRSILLLCLSLLSPFILYAPTPPITGRSLPSPSSLSPYSSRVRRLPHSLPLILLHLPRLYSPTVHSLPRSPQPPPKTTLATDYDPHLQIVAKALAGGKIKRPGYRDGPPEDALFLNDFDVVYVHPTCSLLVVDRENDALRQISINQEDCDYQYSSISSTGKAFTSKLHNGNDVTINNHVVSTSELVDLASLILVSNGW